MILGINFTGHGIDPATERRPLDVINLWGGNRPMTQAQLDEEDAAWERFYQELKDEGLLPKDIVYGPERYPAEDKAKQTVRERLGTLARKIRWR